MLKITFGKCFSGSLCDGNWPSSHVKYDHGIQFSCYHIYRYYYSRFNVDYEKMVKKGYAKEFCDHIGYASIVAQIVFCSIETILREIALPIPPKLPFSVASLVAATLAVASKVFDGPKTYWMQCSLNGTMVVEEIPCDIKRVVVCMCPHCKVEQWKQHERLERAKEQLILRENVGGKMKLIRSQAGGSNV